MKFESKFNIGDTVWKIVQEKEKVWIKCTFCDGRGVIHGADGEECACPSCYRKGGEYKYKDLKWKVAHVLTIGQIGIEFRGETDGYDRNSMFTNYGPQEEYYKEEYMCLETGIGSGTIHRSDCLFHTKEESQKECDKLNSELKAVRE